MLHDTRKEVQRVNKMIDFNKHSIEYILQILRNTKQVYTDDDLFTQFLDTVYQIIKKRNKTNEELLNTISEYKDNIQATDNEIPLDAHTIEQYEKKWRIE